LPGLGALDADDPSPLGGAPPSNDDPEGDPPNSDDPDAELPVAGFSVTEAGAGGAPPSREDPGVGVPPSKLLPLCTFSVSPLSARTSIVTLDNLLVD